MNARNFTTGTGVTAALISLPILYVLSLGPLVYAIEKSRHPLSPKAEAAIEVFYAPVEIMTKYQPFRHVLARYIQWWSEAGMKP